jgi:hypothetical protein
MVSIRAVSTLIALMLVFGYVSSAAVKAASASSENSANHLRAMAARNKRAPSVGLLPGRIRFEEDNQRRARRTFVEPAAAAAAPIFEDSAAAAANEEASLLAGLTTEQLYRMLDLLNRIENQEPVDASPHELATLNYLLQSYQN